MTFLVACKVNDIVYLCADSAVTSGGRRSPAETTSFGELHRNNHLVVEEAALKLSTFCNVCTAIAGDAESAWDFLRTYKQDLESSGDAIGSFRRAAISHSPIDPHRQYTVFVAISEPEGGRLLTFNGNGTNQIEELNNNQVVYKGPMPSANRDVILEQLQILMHSDITTPYGRITAMLATLQNNGIHDYTLRHGIGGAYAGMYVDNESVHHQPRILYSIAADNPEDTSIVMTGFFESAFIVRSLLHDNFLVFSNTITIDTDELLSRNPIENAENSFLQAEFDYVVLLSRRAKRVVIIEMRRNNETRYCTISSTYDKSDDSDKVHMELSMNKGVGDLITGERQETSHYHIDTSFYFVNFEEKPVK